MTVHDRKNTAQSCSLDLHTLFRVSHDEDQGDQHGNLIGQMFIHSKAKIMWEVISFFLILPVYGPTHLKINNIGSGYLDMNDFASNIEIEKYP